VHAEISHPHDTALLTTRAMCIRGGRSLPCRQAAQLHRGRFGQRAAGDRDGIGDRLLVGFAGDEIAAARPPAADGVTRIGLLVLMQSTEEGDEYRPSRIREISGTYLQGRGGTAQRDGEQSLCFSAPRGAGA
jgi:hypothetical protein